MTAPEPLIAPNSGAERGARAHPIRSEAERRTTPTTTLLYEARKRFMPDLTGTYYSGWIGSNVDTTAEAAMVTHPYRAVMTLLTPIPTADATRALHQA